jgi:hypothetical protein
MLVHVKKRGQKHIKLKTIFGIGDIDWNRGCIILVLKCEEVVM